MTTSKNLVSIIMSVYNSEDTIIASIESLIKQSYENIEILILDDASTDMTYEICKGYEADYSKVKVYNNIKNLGLTKSLNILIKKTKGNFIARQDADDTSKESRIENQYSFLVNHSLDACTTRANIKDTNKLTPNKSYYLPPKVAMKIKNPFIHGTLLIRKNILESVGLYDERFYYSQDYKLMADLIKKGYKVKIMKDSLYVLNMDGNISVNNKNEQKYYADCVRKNKKPKTTI